MDYSEGRNVNRALLGRMIRVVAVLALAMLAAACDRAALLAPTDSIVTLSVGSRVVTSGGSTTLTAMVIEAGGTPVQNGTTVRFMTSLGRLESAEAQTRNGVATTTLLADGNSGVATVRAVSGNAESEEVTISMGAGAVDTIAVRALPSSVPASGGTATITATVVGENNRALSGLPVSFTTSNGTLSASTATTDANGVATVTLTTNRESIVTAAVGAISSTTTVTVATTASVTLAATAGAAGSPTTLTVTPATGTAPNVIVEWGDGTNTSLGVVSSARTVTHVYGSPGTYIITANATDNGQTVPTSIAVAVGPRPAATVTASPTSGPAASTTFAFTITPATANGVRGITIDFGDGSEPVDLGAITTATTVTHRFGSAGSYTVRVTQTDSAGNTTTSVVVVTAT